MIKGGKMIGNVNKLLNVLLRLGLEDYDQWHEINTHIYDIYTIELDQYWEIRYGRDPLGIL